MTRNLLEEIAQPRKAQRQNTEFVCSLAKNLECCQGLGYQLEDEGAYVAAKPCRCLKSCKLCYGRARKLDGDGNSVPCSQPSPVRLVGLINEAGIPARYKDARLNLFRNYASGNGKDVQARIGRWCETVGQRGSDASKKGFILWGDVGVGKTYLLCSVAFKLIEQGISVKFVDFFQLLMELRAAYSENGSDARVLGPLLSVDILIIDELGKGRNTDWELSILDQLVMGRYNRNKLILASTNYSPAIAADEELSHTDLQQNGQPGFTQIDHKSLEGRVGKRIFSRLRETSSYWRLSGDDYRFRDHTSSSANRAPGAEAYPPPQRPV